MTFLFGAKQIGISLVTHRGGSGEAKAHALKTSVESAHDALSRNILNALAALAGENAGRGVANLLAESLLHSCLRLLRAPEARKPRKAMRTYEMLCLYVQENFQQPLTRESVAEHLGIAPGACVAPVPPRGLDAVQRLREPGADEPGQVHPGELHDSAEGGSGELRLCRCCLFLPGLQAIRQGYAYAVPRSGNGGESFDALLGIVDTETSA